MECLGWDVAVGAIIIDAFTAIMAAACTVGWPGSAAAVLPGSGWPSSAVAFDCCVPIGSGTLTVVGRTSFGHLTSARLADGTAVGLVLGNNFTSSAC